MGLRELIPSLYGPVRGARAFAASFMRGIANSSEFTNGGTQPSVAVYVDDMPVTTLDANLEYPYVRHRTHRSTCPARKERYLAQARSPGPSGTSRMPRTQRVHRRLRLTGTTFRRKCGPQVEAFVNVPVADQAAFDSSVIRNMTEATSTTSWGRRRFFRPRDCRTPMQPLSIRISMRSIPAGARGFADRFQRSLDIEGGRVGQRAVSDGIVGYTPELGDLNVARYLPDRYEDRWWMGKLKIEGHIGHLETTYEAGYIQRQTGFALGRIRQ